MCTIFRTENKEEHRFIIGKNYDVPDPCKIMLFINPANENKQALINSPDMPVCWCSKYRSITYNQVCKDFPAGGMNEKGLVIEQATLWNTVYPDRDSRLAIRELQWIQLMLDTCETTEEVINKSKEVRISQETSKLHYFICDASGDTCHIEYILGEGIYHRNNQFPYPVVTNDMYSTCVDYLNIHAGYGGIKEIHQTDMSIDRFVVTANAIMKISAQDRQNCFRILQMSTYANTQCSIVFDTKETVALYRAKGTPRMEVIAIKDVPCVDYPLVLMPGEKTFTKLTFAKNLELLQFFMVESNYFKAKVAKKDITGLAQYTYGKER